MTEKCSNSDFVDALQFHLMQADLLTDHLGNWSPPNEDEAFAIARETARFLEVHSPEILRLR